MNETVEQKLEQLQQECQELLDYIMGDSWNRGNPPVGVHIEVCLPGKDYQYNGDSTTMQCFSKDPWDEESMVSLVWRTMPQVLVAAQETALRKTHRSHERC